jgi:hypothetical protein
MLAKQALYHLSHSSILFCSGYLEMGREGLSNYLPELGSENLSISASQVARITGMSHQYSACFYSLIDLGPETQAHRGQTGPKHTSV